MAYTPELVYVGNYKKNRFKTWSGSVYMSIANGGYGKISTPNNITFSKTGSYGWFFWVKFDTDDSVYRQIIKLGTPGENGYRIVKDKSGGNNVISLQEMSSSYTSDSWRYPSGFDVTSWHNVCITWKGNSATSVSSNCFINGVQINTKSSSITWANAIDTSSPLYIGDEWADHTIGGYINDIAFFQKKHTGNSVFKLINTDSFAGAVSVYRCFDLSGSELSDRTELNNMPIYGGAELGIVNQTSDYQLRN